MRKSELIKHIPERIPCLTVNFFRACGEDVLMIAGTAERWREWETHEEQAVHFVWKEGYLTFWPSGNTWTRESLRTVDFGTIGCQYDATNRFLERNAPECENMYEFERQMDWKKEKRKNERKQKKIDDLMNSSTPPLPRGFIQRIRSMAKDVKTRKRMNIKMFQRVREDVVVERMFKVTRERTGYLTIFEFCRAFTGDYGDIWNCWYYGWHERDYGRKQQFWPTKQGGIGNIPNTFRIYDNFAEESMTKQQETCLREMDGLADPSTLLNHLHFCPDLEYIIKSGWKRMAAELCGRYVSAEECRLWIDGLKKLDRNMLCRLRKADAGMKAAGLLQENPKLSDKWLKEVTSWKQEQKIDEVGNIGRRGLNLNHVLTLLEKTGGVKYENIRLYEDYLDMAERRNENIHDEIIYRNKRWREFHDRYLEEINRQREEKRREELRNRFGEIRADYRRNKKIFGWSDGENCIIVPKTCEDIMDEGKKQHHCVGASDRYMRRMAKRETWIVFLRHAEDPKEPWYTIETDGETVLQFYAAYDRQPEKEEVQKILNAWMKEVRKNMEKVLKEEAEKQREEEILQAAG